MGIYSDVLRCKEINNTHLEQTADKSLKDNYVNIETFDKNENTRKAISEILKHFKINTREVRSYSTTEELLDAMLDPENILYEKININNNTHKNNPNFILAFEENGTPLILSPGIVGYKYFQPTTKKRGIITKKIKLMDDAYVIFRPLSGKNFSLGNFLKLMVHLISPNDVFYIVIATLAVSLLGLVAPSLNKSVLSRAVEIGEGAIPYLLTSGLVFIIAGLAKSFFSVVKTFLLGNMKHRMSTQVQTTVIAKLLLMPYEFFSTGATGKRSNQIRASRKISDMIIDFFMSNFLNVIFSLVYIPQMRSLAPSLVISALTILCVQMLISIALNLASARYTAMKLAIHQDSESFVFEALKGIQKIQNMGAQKRVYAKIAEGYKDVLTSDLTPPAYILHKTSIMSFISSIGTVIILINAAMSGVSQTDYIAFTSSYALMITPVFSMAKAFNNAISMKPLLNQLQDLLSYEGEEKGVEYVSKLRGEIELKDLCFSYNKNERGCVDKINLHIKPGEKVAFVGTSGCGKSTLMKLLLGMIIPDSGYILYDGKPLQTLNKRSLRRKIASVFQFTRVFPGTVLDNICFTSNNVDEKIAWEAAKQAAIDNDIRNLPLGMNTEISEGNGNGFSGGQKQRLMLARAFAQKPSVLILDEATSALDNISQHKVLQSVYKMKCTVLMVAHRLSTVINCDRIIVLENGKIVEQGNYETLMKNNGKFAELVRKQQIAEKNDKAKIDKY